MDLLLSIMNGRKMTKVIISIGDLIFQYYSFKFKCWMWRLNLKDTDAKNGCHGHAPPTNFWRGRCSWAVVDVVACTCRGP